MKVLYGLKNVHYAVYDSELKTYAKPVRIPGAVNLNLDASGDEASFAADNNPKYFATYSNGGYTGSLEVALLPKSFLIDVMGMTEDSNGALIEKIGDKQKEFALLFEVEGDTENRRTVFYKVSASRASTSASTTEQSVDVKTQTLNISAGANDKDLVKAVLDGNKTGYDTFFEAVYTEAE